MRPRASVQAPWLGLTIIKSMMRKGLDYENGTILDPRYGTEWKALMNLNPDGQDLTVRGFLGLPTFGKNQYWKRLPDCWVHSIRARPRSGSCWIIR